MEIVLTSSGIDISTGPSLHQGGRFIAGLCNLDNMVQWLEQVRICKTGMSYMPLN